MSLAAAHAVFGIFHIGFSLRAELLPTVPVLLVIGTLAAIVISRYLRERKNQGSREHDGRSGSKDPSED